MIESNWLSFALTFLFDLFSCWIVPFLVIRPVDHHLGHCARALYLCTHSQFLAVSYCGYAPIVVVFLHRRVVVSPGGISACQCQPGMILKFMLSMLISAAGWLSVFQHEFASFLFISVDFSHFSHFFFVRCKTGLAEILPYACSDAYADYTSQWRHTHCHCIWSCGSSTIAREMEQGCDFLHGVGAGVCGAGVIVAVGVAAPWQVCNKVYLFVTWQCYIIIAIVMHDTKNWTSLV